MNWALAAAETAGEAPAEAAAGAGANAGTEALSVGAAAGGGAGKAAGGGPRTAPVVEAAPVVETEPVVEAEPDPASEARRSVPSFVTPPAAALPDPVTPASAPAAPAPSAAATPEALAAAVAVEPAGEPGTGHGPRPGRVSRPMIAAAVAVGLVLIGTSVVVTQLGGNDHGNGPSQADAPPGFGQGGGDGGSGFVPGYDEHGGTSGGGTPAPDGQPGAVVPPGDAGPAPTTAGEQPAPAPNGSGGSSGGGGGGGAAQPGGGTANTGAGAGSSTGGTGQAQGGSGGAASGGAGTGGAKPVPQPPAPNPSAPNQPAPPPAAGQNPAPPPVVAKPPAPVTAVAGPYCGGYRTNGWYDDGDKGWRNYSGGYSGDGCNGTYAAMPMSGDGKDKGNSVVWSFTLDKVTSCTLAVYIPASGNLKQVGGNPSYYTVQSGGASAGSFTINQTASRGSWVTQGPFPYRGPITLTLHDRGIDWGAAAGAHHAASAVRATCTP
ncbi:hypothetical protein ACIRD3_07045 [Kitasatospora sp. NPDC093550]|uniref:hypothetical protein n=1 Tax=Kitasatospora sp. NPDC093550 TaxID=3364089 RepID=UPI00382DC578